MPTVYSKLQELRAELADTELTKSGENKYSGYKYYELTDFEKPIVRLLKKYSLCTAFDFTKHFAILKIFDVEKPDEYITFHSPMADASVKGCQAIQNLGAIETYERRYLYLMAFDISEPDGLEVSTGKDGNNPSSKSEKTNPNKKPQKSDKNKPTNEPKYLTVEQSQKIWTAMKKKFGENAKSMIKAFTGHEKLSEVPSLQYENIMKVIAAYDK